MHNIWIVFRSEFLRRVTSKWFILTTLLAPIAMTAFFAIIIFVSVSSLDTEQKTVAVVDETGVLLARMLAVPQERVQLVATEAPVDSIRKAVTQGTWSGYLVVPPRLVAGEGEVVYYAKDGSELIESVLEGLLSQAVDQQRLAERNVAPDVLEVLEGDVEVSSIRLTDEGEDAGSSGGYMMVGFILGLLIYMSMLIYGSVVMQAVIEEKQSRVVEVIVSSVRPFDLLMGKVLGIGAMGLVQMAVWAVLILAGTTFAGSVVALFVNPTELNLPDTASQEEVLQAVNFSPPTLGPEVFVWFILFFLVGYLLYASLFAAVGSAIEQQQDAQGLMLPVMMPIILSIMFLTPVIESPNSPLAVTLSMIPFFSPIPMVVRVAVAQVPFWQPLLSFLLLFGTFLGAVWLSARIYRIGILMYGKKPRLKDLMRWVRYS
jgi:ABC-2 type transport system permease protein